MKFSFHILFITGAIALGSCTSNSNSENTNHTDKTEVDSLVNVTENNNPVEMTFEGATTHLDSVFSNYTTDERHDYPDDSTTREALLKLRIENEDSLKSYVTWFMLKKYRFHLECCNQGYDLRLTAGPREIDSTFYPILYQFLRFSHSFDDEGWPIDSLMVNNYEFIHSGFSVVYLEDNLDLLDFEPIAQEYDKILKIYELMRDPDFDVVPQDYYKVYE